MFIDKYKNLPIKYKLLLLLYVQVLLPLVFLGFIFYKKTESIMETHAVEMSLDMLQNIEMRIDDYMNNVAVLSRDLLMDQEVYDVLNANQQDVFEYYGKVNRLKNVLRKRAISYEAIQSITIISQDGQIHSYDANSGRANIEDIIPYASLLPKAREKKGGVVWQVIGDGDETHVFLARLINDNDTYEEIGLMVILVNMEPLKASYSSLRSDILRNIVITTKNKRKVFVSGSSTEEIMGLLPDQYEQSGGVITNKRVDQVISYRTLSVADWVVLSSFSRSALTKEFSNLQNWMWTILVPMLLLLSFMSLLASLDIANPINLVIERMKAYKEGKDVDHSSLGRKDEIGFLADNLEEMTMEIDHLMKNIYQEQLHRKESQVRALQAQINPHFLFNTLETINWQAQLAQAPEISDMVTSLSNVMEGSLASDIDQISLESEISYVRSYLSIMHYRLGERLEVLWEISDQTLSIPVPRLILQPIVENAIEHGISKQMGTGSITIRSALDDGNLIIRIHDNGKGIGEKNLLNLKKRLSETVNTATVLKAVKAEQATPQRRYKDPIEAQSNDQAQDHKQGQGHWIGMNNVNRRLKLLYGEMYGMSVESVEGSYTEVTLKLPIQKETPNV